jgi:hypothetical protein
VLGLSPIGYKALLSVRLQEFMTQKGTILNYKQKKRMIKIIDNTYRNKLNEGRSYGLGFAFAKKLDDETFELVQPISPCKDYLNDTILAENNDVEFTACGLVSSKKNIFDDEIYCYLAIAVCNNKYNSAWDPSSNIKQLNSNYKNIEIFINKIEMELNVPFLSKIEKVEDNLYLLKVPHYWRMSSYAISLYSLLVRNFMNISDNELDINIDTLVLLGNTLLTNLSNDTQIMNSVIIVYPLIKQNGFKEQDFKYTAYITNPSCIHGHGVVHYKQTILKI